MIIRNVIESTKESQAYKCTLIRTDNTNIFLKKFICNPGVEFHQSILKVLTADNLRRRRKKIIVNVDYTTDSQLSFDEWLEEQNRPYSNIRKSGMGYSFEFKRLHDFTLDVEDRDSLWSSDRGYKQLNNYRLFFGINHIIAELDSRPKPIITSSPMEITEDHKLVFQYLECRVTSLIYDRLAELVVLEFRSSEILTKDRSRVKQLGKRIGMDMRFSFYGYPFFTYKLEPKKLSKIEPKTRSRVAYNIVEVLNSTPNIKPINVYLPDRSTLAKRLDINAYKETFVTTYVSREYRKETEFKRHRYFPQEALNGYTDHEIPEITGYDMNSRYRAALRTLDFRLPLRDAEDLSFLKQVIYYISDDLEMYNFLIYREIYHKPDLIEKRLKDFNLSSIEDLHKLNLDQIKVFKLKYRELYAPYLSIQIYDKNKVYNLKNELKDDDLMNIRRIIPQSAKIYKLILKEERLYLRQCGYVVNPLYGYNSSHTNKIGQIILETVSAVEMKWKEHGLLNLNTPYNRVKWERLGKNPTEEQINNLVQEINSMFGRKIHTLKKVIKSVINVYVGFTALSTINNKSQHKIIAENLAGIPYRLDRRSRRAFGKPQKQRSKDTKEPFIQLSRKFNDEADEVIKGEWSKANQQLINFAVVVHSRIKIHKDILNCLKNGDTVYYSQTDSIYTSAAPSVINCGPNIGQFKIESSNIKRLLILRMNRYMVISGNENQPILKGFNEASEFKSAYARQSKSLGARFQIYHKSQSIESLPWIFKHKDYPDFDSRIVKHFDCKITYNVESEELFTLPHLVTNTPINWCPWPIRRVNELKERITTRAYKTIYDKKQRDKIVRKWIEIYKKVTRYCRPQRLPIPNEETKDIVNYYIVSCRILIWNSIKKLQLTTPGFVSFYPGDTEHRKHVLSEFDVNILDKTQINNYVDKINYWVSKHSCEPLSCVVFIQRRFLIDHEKWFMSEQAYYQEKRRERKRHKTPESVADVISKINTGVHEYINIENYTESKFHEIIRPIRVKKVEEKKTNEIVESKKNELDLYLEDEENEEVDNELELDLEEKENQKVENIPDGFVVNFKSEFNKIDRYLIARRLKKRLRIYFLNYDPLLHVKLHRKYRFQRYCKCVLEYKKRWNRGIDFFMPYRMTPKRNIGHTLLLLKQVHHSTSSIVRLKRYSRISKMINGYRSYKIKNKKSRRNYDIFAVGTIPNQSID